MMSLTYYIKMFTHPTCDPNKFHWLPYTGQMSEKWSSGFVGGNVYFRLWVGPPNTALPIELLSCDFTCSKSGVNASWQTATETNNHYFSIERSIDAVYWNKIADIPAAGNSLGVLSYTYQDTIQIPAITYYRLSQTDYDGKLKILETKAIDPCVKTSDISIYPNPVNQIFYAKGPVSAIEIYNNLGQLKQTEKTEPLNPTNEINISQLATGIYFIKCYFNANEFVWFKLNKAE